MSGAEGALEIAARACLGDALAFYNFLRACFWEPQGRSAWLLCLFRERQNARNGHARLSWKPKVETAPPVVIKISLVAATGEHFALCREFRT